MIALKQTIRYEAERDTEFVRRITGFAGGEKIRQCLQCGLCSATCPLSHYMDYTPRRLINLAREGFKKEVLSSFTIWLCASCYACTAECPKKIPLTDVMYALKRQAIQEKYYPKGFPIPVLAREFYRMVFSNGRTTETLLVLKLVLKTNWMMFLSMRKLGINLIRRGRFSLMPESIKRKKELQRILDAVDSQHPKAEP